jgi:hypothetical protein
MQASKLQLTSCISSRSSTGSSRAPSANVAMHAGPHKTQAAAVLAASTPRPLPWQQRRALASHTLSLGLHKTGKNVHWKGRRRWPPQRHTCNTSINQNKHIRMSSLPPLPAAPAAHTKCSPRLQLASSPEPAHARWGQHHGLSSTFSCARSIAAAAHPHVSALGLYQQHQQTPMLLITGHATCGRPHLGQARHAVAGAHCTHL